MADNGKCPRKGSAVGHAIRAPAMVSHKAHAAVRWPADRDRADLPTQDGRRVKATQDGRSAASPVAAGGVTTIATRGIGTDAGGPRGAGLRIAGGCVYVDARVREAPGNREHDRVVGASRIDRDVVTEGVTASYVPNGDAACSGCIRVGNVVHGGNPPSGTATTARG